jgi:hypothetical protein
MDTLSINFFVDFGGKMYDIFGKVSKINLKKSLVFV